MAKKSVISDEAWVPIPGYPNTISTYGRVKSNKNNDYMIPFLNRAGYMAIRLKKDGKYITFPIHRLVAMVFIPKGDDSRVYYFKHKRSDDFLFKQQDNKDAVGHKNGKKYDNRVTNLDWMNTKQVNRIKTKKTIPVLKLCPETNEILDFYESIKDAAAEHYVCANAIQRCLKGHVKTSAGFKWIKDTGEYEEELEAL